MKLSAELRRLVRLAAAMALGAALTGMGLHGEVQARPKNTHPLQEKKASSPALDANAASDEKASRENDLKAVEEALTANAESRRRLEAEIAEIGADRAKLSAALIETTERVRATEDRI